MPEAISDTGPLLHLHEIGQLDALGIFTHLIVPRLVADELRTHGLKPANLGVPGLRISVVVVDEGHLNRVLTEGERPPIHPADAEVLALAYSDNFQKPVLTDDLALRRRLEAAGAIVTGSVGILVRAYKTNRLTRAQLEHALDALFSNSTLHLSRAFRTYVRQLLADLP
ncbi:MAG: hypothetical protein NUW24_14980 [Anaerolineae bacterium]|jgi:predicted nucleic acid-binding protein|nr:hypothetical protein [Anaerolineae bacterium]MDH7475423.1 hypothetical protein [Anaerolineae bacterium]